MFLMFLLLSFQNTDSCQQIESLSWLTGHWQNESGNSREIWLEPAGCSVFGLHQDIVRGRGRIEAMAIESTPEGVVFTAIFKNRDSVSFKAVSWRERSVTFSNPSHDYPQTIKYWRDGSSLCAEIGAEGKDSMRWCWQRSDKP